MPWPAEVERGLVLTDNAMGVMTRELSPPARRFVELAAGAQRPLLEIGAAYGNATLPALAAGATVVANDLSASELAVLAEMAPVPDRRRLVVLPARFPENVNLGDGSVSAVLAAQVLHFFDGETVDQAFASVFRWLEPGGYFLVLVMTPSLSYYRKFRPAFEERLRAGERWPGLFDPKLAATPDWRDRLPDRVNLFEKSILERCALEAGFVVEALDYFCFDEFPDEHRTDGREYVSLIARKPGQVVVV
ncbi:MAG: class I SAM-dependent methyltransferase [Terrimicrobiaceae bacterium]|nr:class I SAM-dependent methyltransferase [Terrimicrobiaceae bacterium]